MTSTGRRGFLKTGLAALGGGTLLSTTAGKAALSGQPTDIKIERIKTRSPAHNMGTCRMGNDPSNSVLNSFCQTHDINNLFVIDASCFVSCGTSNPSLTIQAIAKRSSEYIIKEIKKGKI